MKRMFATAPRVVVILETCVQPDREKLDGILKYVRFYGPWHLHIIQNRVGEQRLKHFATWRADGVIVGQSMLDMEKTLARVKIPLILIDPLQRFLHHRSSFRRCSYLQNDGYSVGQCAAEFFLERGFATFAYVGEALNRLWSSERGRGFNECLGAAGYASINYPLLPPDEIPDWEVEQEHQAAWLKALPKPVALFAAMDIRARQVLDTCLFSGIKVPDEVAILGVDNDEQLCLGSFPTLSSIECDMVQCGFMAARLLDEQMRGKHKQREVLTYGVKRVVERHSTRQAPILEDRMVARALEFIKLNACEGIGVQEVVSFLRVSRRLIEMRFKEACGHTILDEIRKVRLLRVRCLLRDTDLPISEITMRSGYQTEDHLRRMFKRDCGLTMQIYRQQAQSGNLSPSLLADE